MINIETFVYSKRSFENTILSLFIIVILPLDVFHCDKVMFFFVLFRHMLIYPFCNCTLQTDLFFSNYSVTSIIKKVLKYIENER
jgi:hypothetical protein